MTLIELVHEHTFLTFCVSYMMLNGVVRIAIIATGYHGGKK